MANFSSIIKQLRTERGITQEQLAALLKVSRSTVGMYETGSREPDFETCEAIADIFNVDMDYLMGRSTVERRNPIFSLPSNCEPLPSTVKRPLLGTIACGEPITAEQNIESYVDVPEGVHCDFCLRCKGDSMIGANILDGDLVYIRIQQDVDDGEIAAVLIDDEATLKRVYKIPGRVQLRPENPSYPVLEYTGPELETIRILGKAVGYTHWFQ